jgi:hypothetical protein
MNERIRKLAKKSGFSLDKNGIYTAKLEHLPITENMEKFAELIVRECAGIYEKIDNGNLHMGTDNYLEALQKHFRIEA